MKQRFCLTSLILVSLPQQINAFLFSNFFPRCAGSLSSSHRFVRAVSTNADSGLASLMSSRRTGTSPTHRPVLLNLRDSSRTGDSRHNPYSVLTPVSPCISEDTGAEMPGTPSLHAASFLPCASERGNRPCCSRNAGLDTSVATGSSLPYVR